MLFIRSVVFYVGYVLVTLVLAFASLVFFWVFPEHKRDLFNKLWCSVVLVWCRAVCGIRYRIHGIENIPDSPVVVLANHQSEWETMFLYRYLAPISPILKKELLAIPVYGWAMRLVKPIAIDRSRRHRAGKSILNQGQQRLSNGRSVMIFPEGTRSEVGKVGKFSRGGAKLAIAAKVPILPIAHNAGQFWPAHRFLKHPGTIHVHVGMPVETSNRDASELTAETEGWIRQHIAS
ncbi:MAG: 1-acyl-sn-glycerol-3-phosphate acyltransferase [Gammaproteobacteria bacterium]|nr:1-acyl-sn-glycerol-3-phosphate acyltransferase [Gammaproteobacteria bacterium]